MKAGCAILLGAMFAIYFGTPATSATIRSLVAKDNRVVVQVSGRIEIGDGDILLGALKQAKAGGNIVESVQLNSPGGRLVEGAKLAAVIKAEKLATYVGSGGVCASACFLAFAAGNPKFAGPGALIGVHKASDRGGRETTQSGAATHSMAHFARELGVPSWIVDRMLITPANQIAWLDAEDFRAMGVKITEKPVQALPVRREDPSVAQVPPNSPASASLLPDAKAVAIRPPWNEFIEQTIALSAAQNQGQAALARNCKADSKECVMQVAYLLKDGRKAVATIIQDGNGHVTRREVCESNVTENERECADWDNGAKYRDVKNTKGDWVQTQQ
jgi:hypothetical protein